jgi:hypothetical protein
LAATYRVTVHPKNKFSIGYNKVLAWLAGILNHSCYSEQITALERKWAIFFMVAKKGAIFKP